MNPRTGGRTATVRARDVFQAIVDAAWRTGDPGLIFLDAVNRANPTPHVGRLDATNPCGEIPLLPYESCNLGSINLAHMLREAGGRAEPDRAKLARAARTAVRFLDDVIEASRYPAPEIARVTRGNRKIGLGVMGFAEMLVRLGVPYGSEEAEVVAAEVMGAIEAEAWEASAELAAERGPYPNWKGGVHEARGRLMRNATCTAVAPTGTIGIIAGTSPSIEPLFALAYRRSHVLGEETLFEVNPLFMDALERRGADAKRIAREVVRRGRLADVEGAPEDMKRLFVTALDVPPERHLAIQAAFQRHVDNAVSKTINMPAGSRREDVARAYMSAWELGLKGVTIYRYGSAATQVMELGSGEDARGHEHAARCDPEECRL
jgi:ribonucleoside-diphosphate reductase alpha chain